MPDLKIVTVPKDLYYHEAAYVRGLETAASAMLAALKWAFPLAVIAMEDHRLARVKAGHGATISGTYPSGKTYGGIYQGEVDDIERARAAIAQAEAAGIKSEGR